MRGGEREINFCLVSNCVVTKQNIIYNAQYIVNGRLDSLEQKTP